MSAAVCARVARYLSGRPLCIEPNELKSMLDAVGPRLGLSADADEGAAPTFAERRKAAHVQRLAAVFEAESIDVAEGMGEYGLTADGVAVISIVGSLMDRYDWLAAWCGFCSYDSIKLSLQAALADDRVRAILLDIDSPGGEAAGMLDTADRVRAAAAVKPVWAVANTLAASAAYSIAAGAPRLVLPRMGMVGSIGVVAVHVDQSAADAEYGLKYTALYSGARKVDGWGHAPLSRPARERFQAQMDEARLKFATAVAGFRGLHVDAVMATEAGVYDDEEAVKAGLADAVMPFEQALAELTESVRAKPGSAPRGPAAHNPRETLMGTTTGPAGKLSASETEGEKPEDEKKPADKAKGDGKKGEPEQDEPEKKGPKDKEPADDKEAITAAAMARAAEIVGIVRDANRICPDLKADAEVFLKQGNSPDVVRKALWEQMAARGPEIRNSTMPDTNSTGTVWDQIDAADKRKKG